MIKIQNREELDAVIEATRDLEPLYLNNETEQCLYEVLYDNIAILTKSYGEYGDGGYICIITDSISTETGLNEYLGELEKYNLEEIPDGYEYDDVLGTDGKEEVHIQLFALTEFNLIFVFRKKVEDE